MLASHGQPLLLPVQSNVETRHPSKRQEEGELRDLTERTTLRLLHRGPKARFHLHDHRSHAITLTIRLPGRAVSRWKCSANQPPECPRWATTRSSLSSARRAGV